jgi:cytochrome c553
MHRAAGGLFVAVALATAAAGLAVAQDKPRTDKGGAAAAAPKRSSASAAPAAKVPVDYAQRYAATCAACHGANGRSDQAGTPVLAGQPSLYAITQLYLFREGRRANEAMTAVAKGLSDDDMRGYADHIGTLPPVPAPVAADTDPQRMAKGRTLAGQYRCTSCHGAALEGGQQVPRIAGQKEDYLLASLQGFKSGKRAAYTQAMVAAMSAVPAEDLDTLAYYAARFTEAPAGK